MNIRLCALFATALLLFTWAGAYSQSREVQEKYLSRRWIYEPSFSQAPSSLLEKESLDKSDTELQLEGELSSKHVEHYEFAVLQFKRSGKLRYRNQGGIERDGRWRLSGDGRTLFLELDEKTYRYRVEALTPSQLVISHEDGSRWVFSPEK
ncbi:hypothetical protein FHS56_001587 [Thermonema lapsum]|uniref:Lipocalin-like domain-containing protein n=1 Tax=Thermonema lapsum TaxID=28195 RepID=A0A846MR64_9BACT|nr:hypothetical protein [Thermonema lapsum]NIK74074.1 hypothetical protein [Thermonema lapsum]